jgi:hypothetical protein
VNVSCCELRIDWKLHIDSEAILRAMGADPRAIRERQPRFVSFAEEMVAEHARLLRPRVAIRKIVVGKGGAGRLVSEDGIELRSETLRQRLARAESVVAVVGTIGNELEASAASRDLEQSLILEALGTAGITTLAESILDDIRRAAKQQGLEATRALYPGMKGWELGEGQAQIFALVDGRAAGVSLNSSFVMMPRKSVSFLVGIGSAVKEGPRACEQCEVAAHCRHKTQLYAS